MEPKSHRKKYSRKTTTDTAVHINKIKPTCVLVRDAEAELPGHKNLWHKYGV
jgi:hypothetical protein